MKMWLVFIFLGVVTARLSDEKCKDYYRKPNLQSDDILNDFPHMGFIGCEEDDMIQYQCATTLISESFALVAPHCLIYDFCRETTKQHKYYITFGTSTVKKDIEKPNNKHFNVTNVYLHPNYTRDGHYNMVALVKFYPPIALNNNKIKPGCLYTKSFDGQQRLMDLCWRTGDVVLFPMTLTKRTPIILSPEKCLSYGYEIFNSKYKHTYLCLDRYKDRHYVGGASHILEDEMFKIVAIDSHILGVVDRFDIVTKLYYYLDWIEEVVWKNNTNVTIS